MFKMCKKYIFFSITLKRNSAKGVCCDVFADVCHDKCFSDTLA